MRPSLMINSSRSHNFNAYWHALPSKPRGNASTEAASTSVFNSASIFTLLRAEWQRANDALNLITGDSERLQSNPALARSIAHRFPYLDPLNHLQVELMRRYRNRKEGQDGVDRLQRGIHLSINGIAAGLRNTG